MLWMKSRLGINRLHRAVFGFVRADSVVAFQHPDGMATWTRTELGALGEQLAVEHLTGRGLQILARNWRCPRGELDVIAVEPVTDTLVFVEVKTRTGDGFGGLEEAVTPRKVRRLRLLALLWLAGQDRHWTAIRIDVVRVRIRWSAVPDAAGCPQISHLEGIG